MTRLEFWMPQQKPEQARVYVHGADREFHFAMTREGGLEAVPKRPPPRATVRQYYALRRAAEGVLHEHRLFRSWEDPQQAPLVFLYAQAPETVRTRVRAAGVAYVSLVPGAPPAVKLKDGELIDLPGRWPLSVENPYAEAILRAAQAAAGPEHALTASPREAESGPATTLPRRRLRPRP